MKEAEKSCNGADFIDNPLNGGLVKITKSLADEYATNYQRLIGILASDDPTAGGSLPPDLLKRTLAIHGYYVGKEQLSCLLDHAFGSFRGIQLQLGLTQHPIDGETVGNLVYLIGGLYNGDRPTPASYQPEIATASETTDWQPALFGNDVYIAGRMPLVQQPDPPVHQNPPYGSSTVE
ncbi:hypothetical protein FAES_3454 [Fibrella aestuarina BUZ 2]|uniref:Uncharacterized protein n=1 Tax=Fibrella aestuarina BUZ 2 TaxID=1166018 RepID=I0KBF8_9BACT|nr:hypothetical protein [Fibrella aestuarina]CCH01461.1 hypothetical protein FAES_3454 [Fibrella aestuarina BUZ 2]